MRYLISIALLVFMSCSRHYYSTTRSLPEGTKFIQLDTSFKFYTRKVYKDTHKVEGGKLTTNDQLTNKDLIEIEYLLISKEHDQAIYITTIPDPIQLYYREHPVFAGELNIEDFNRFHFGVVKANLIEFVDQKSRLKSTWVMGGYREPNSIRIERIIQKRKGRTGGEFVYDNEISVDEALEQPIYFLKENSFRFVLARSREKEVVPVLADDRIYFTQTGSRFRIYFSLDNAIPGKSDSTLYFSNNRVHFSPDHLVE